MSATLDITETLLFTTVRSFLLSILPTGVEVIRAQINRAPEPVLTDFVVLNMTRRTRLATNVETWDRTNPNPVSDNIAMPTQIAMQADVHGVNGADNSQLIVALWRSNYACQQFQANAPGLGLAPLYIEDAKQIPFIDGEQQYEFRWVIDLELQATPNITLVQDFANALAVGVVNVDAKYPP